MKIYSCSINKCIDFLRHKFESGNEVAEKLLQQIFLPLADGSSNLHDIFLKTVTAIVSVISFAKPWDRTTFLTHLCLSLGRYQTEIDLFCSGDQTSILQYRITPFAFINFAIFSQF